MPKSALITGVTGQDGAYLAKSLLEAGISVHGLVRRNSSERFGRLDELIPASSDLWANFTPHDGDMTDAGSLRRIVERSAPDEIYNLAAQSHVRVSFETAEYTAEVDGLGPLRLLEAVRSLGGEKTTRLYQASTSELFGAVAETPQRETTPFRPRSPYGVAKLFAFWAFVNYREAYRMFAANGILFNHESPLRGERFLTRKITLAAARIHAGLQENLSLGNLDAKRDWGHAADYVEGMRLILAQKEPDDFVLASGESHTVREFAEAVFSRIGRKIAWEGEGVNERGIDAASGKTLITVDPAFFRPTEVETLLGDASKARSVLGWRPKYTFDGLIDDMLRHDLERVNRN